MTKKPESIIVVGGGVVGHFIAYRLAIEGVDVTLVEKDRIEVGNPGSGASGTSAGNLQPGGNFSGEYWRNLTFESYQLLRSFLPEIKKTSNTEIMDQEVNYLYPALSASEAGHLQKDSEYRSKAGLRVHWIDGDQARGLEPRLSADILGGMLHQDCTQLDPQRFISALSESAETHSAQIRLAEAVGLHSKSGRVSGVQFKDGTSLRCDTVVLAAGAWTGNLTAEWLGTPLPTSPVNVQKLHLRARGEPLKCAVSWGGVNMVLRRDGVIHAGSREDPTSGYASYTTDEGRDWILERVTAVLPGLEIETSERMAASVVQGNTPILGPIKALEGVFVAVPRYEGFLLAAILAEMLENLLLRNKQHRFLAGMLP